MAGPIPIIVSKSSMDYILGQPDNKDKLFVILAEEIPDLKNKMIEDELIRIERTFRESDTENVSIARVFCKTAPELKAEFGIKDFPTVLFLKDRVKIGEHVGIAPGNIETMIKKLALV